MDFYPEPRPVPSGLTTDEFILEPLTTDHVELDYAALMDSNEMLRLWSGSTWPEDDFTLAQNWEDLDRHAREHRARDAFTYTVLDAPRTRCVGCVYIQPPTMFGDSSAEGLQDVGSNAALVSFWVRAPHLTDSMDRRLLDVLRRWLTSGWDFAALYFSVRSENTQQRTLLESAGLVSTTTLTLGKRGRVNLFQIAE